MCYNCGCRIAQDDMGDSNNITDQTFKSLAKTLGQEESEIKSFVKMYLEDTKKSNKEIEDVFEKAAKAWGQSIEEAKKNTLKML